MTKDEREADKLLMEAKGAVKDAIRLLDPAPRDPLATSLLKILDTIDEARRKLKNRM